MDAEGPEVKHSFRSEGPHFVTLTVTNKDGSTDSKTKKILIQSVIHVPENISSIRAAIRSVKPGGKVLISEGTFVLKRESVICSGPGGAVKSAYTTIKNATINGAITLQGGAMARIENVKVDGIFVLNAATAIITNNKIQESGQWGWDCGICIRISPWRSHLELPSHLLDPGFKYLKVTLVDNMIQGYKYGIKALEKGKETIVECGGNKVSGSIIADYWPAWLRNYCTHMSFP